MNVMELKTKFLRIISKADAIPNKNQFYNFFYTSVHQSKLI